MTEDVVDRMTSMANSRLIDYLGVGVNGQTACLVLIKCDGDEEIHPVPTRDRALTIYGAAVTSPTPGKTLFKVFLTRSTPDRDAKWRWMDDGA